MIDRALLGDAAAAQIATLLVQNGIIDAAAGGQSAPLRRTSDEVAVRVSAHCAVERFFACVEACGALLGEHVPAIHERNKLPDRLVLLG